MRQRQVPVLLWQSGNIPSKITNLSNIEGMNQMVNQCMFGNEDMYFQFLVVLELTMWNDSMNVEVGLSMHV